MTPPSEDVREQFRAFIIATTKKGSKSQDEMVTTAMHLLKVLPSSTEAVLEYIASLYKEVLRDYLSSRVTERGEEEMEKLETQMRNIDDVLMELISINPIHWSLLLSKWSIKILGDMSGDYSCQRAIPMAMNLNTLNDHMLFWTSCRASNSLVHILLNCLSNMPENEMFACFDLLLITSLRFSPHFDWVIAHIGSCFPDAIITRMLQCGLKDYHQNARTTAPSSSATLPRGSKFCPPPPLPTPQSIRMPPPMGSRAGPSFEGPEIENVSRVPSVVGILSYLALHHDDKLEAKILKLFKDSLEDTASEEHHTTPMYLLYLVSQSPVLLKTTTRAFLNHVNLNMLNILSGKVVERNLQSYLDYSSAIGMISRILKKVESQAFEMLQYLMNLATGMEKKESDMETSDDDFTETPVSLFCRKLLNDFSITTQKLVYSSSSNLSPEVRVLHSLRESVLPICQLFNSSKSRKQVWLCKILACLAVGDTRDVARDILTIVFLLEDSLLQFTAFLDLQKCSELQHVGVIKDVADAILSSVEENDGSSSLSCLGEEAVSKARVVEKLLNLCRWETDPEMVKKYKGTWGARQPIYLQLRENTPRIIELFRSATFQTRLNLMRLLNVIGIPLPGPDVTEPLRLASLTVSIFFSILHNYEDQEKLQLGYECIKYMKTIPTYTAIQFAIIRFLIEEALSPANEMLFGGTNQSNTRVRKASNQFFPGYTEQGLLKANQQLSTIPPTSQLFHTGVIGSGLKKNSVVDPNPGESKNRLLLLEALRSCGTKRLFSSEAKKSGVSARKNPTTSHYPPVVQDEYNLAPEVVKNMSSIVVEMVMPDTLFNTVQWPDEDVLKTNVERDLYVAKKFESQPLLWDLLDMLSTYAAGAWFCLCILRSLLGNLMVQWESSREESASNLPMQLNHTCRVLEYLKKAQVLHEPLSLSVELLPLLNPYEVYLILLNVWRYIKEYSPQTGSKPNFVCPARILDVLHGIMQNNIEKCGHMFALFFKA